MRKHWPKLLRFTVAMLGIAYIIHVVNWSDRPQPDGTVDPGILTTLGRADLGLIALALFMVLAIFPIQTVRWRLLLSARGIAVTWWQCFRLTMVGTFFNYCMPGTTGGDLVKAYYAARHSDRRADAVMSIIVDRVAGLVGLVLLAAFAGLLILEDPAARRVTVGVWIGLGGFLTLAAFYLSVRLRRLTGLDRLIAILPGRGLIQKLDAAAVAFGEHKAAVVNAIALSVPVHLLLALGTALSGIALGLEAPLLLLLTVIPVAFLGAALPISYQGLGIMEGIAIPLLIHADSANATATQVVAMLLLIRLYQIIWGLSGAVFLLRGDIHLRPADTEAEQPDEPQSPQGDGAAAGSPAKL